VENALVLVRGTGAGGIAIQKAQKHVDTAMEALGEGFDGPARDLLESIALEVVSRRS
jgi:geranylgeranyl pyrophosphate synthase